MKSILFAAAAALTFSACASVSLPPKAGPEEVTMINPAMGQTPDDGYKVIGPISVAAPLGTTQDALIQMMLTEAAALGADAMILESISQPNTLDVDREEGPTGKGRAIYYPPPPTIN